MRGKARRGHFLLGEGCPGDTRTVEGVVTMGRVATSVASMVTLRGSIDCWLILNNCEIAITELDPQGV